MATGKNFQAASISKTLAFERPAERMTRSLIGEERTADPSLVRLIVRAHGLARRLAENPGWTLEDVASQQNMGGPYAARLIRLNYLAPDIVAAILDGKQPVDLTANKLMADTRLPLDWRAQRAARGLA